MTALLRGAQCALLATVLLGLCGMPDKCQAKIPLVLVAGVCGWFYFRKKP